MTTVEETHAAIEHAKKTPSFAQYLAAEGLEGESDLEICEHMRQDCAGLLASEQREGL